LGLGLQTGRHFDILNWLISCTWSCSTGPYGRYIRTSGSDNDLSKYELQRTANSKDSSAHKYFIHQMAKKFLFLSFNTRKNTILTFFVIPKSRDWDATNPGIRDPRISIPSTVHYSLFHCFHVYDQTTLTGARTPLILTWRCGSVAQLAVHNFTTNQNKWFANANRNAQQPGCMFETQ